MTNWTDSQLVQKLPEIIGAIGSILAAYWAYKSHKQSTANAVNLTTVETNLATVQKTMLKAPAPK